LQLQQFKFIAGCNLAVSIPNNLPRKVASLKLWKRRIGGIADAMAFPLLNFRSELCITWLGCRFHCVGKLLKGEPVKLVDKGALQKSAMDRHSISEHDISEHDLHEDIRLAGNIDDLKEVKIAQLERSGEISVQRQPQIFDIHIENDVQTIHLLVE
jgi:uncharacterized membrane protein YcaP (DUF421 family)